MQTNKLKCWKMESDYDMKSWEKLRKRPITLGFNAKLNEEYFDRVIKKYILPENRDLKYWLKPSKTTDSVYLFLEVNNAKGAVRFSNHKSLSKIRSVDIQADTDLSTKKIINIIKKRIRQIKHKSLMRAFNKIEGE